MWLVLQYKDDHDYCWPSWPPDSSWAPESFSLCCPFMDGPDIQLLIEDSDTWGITITFMVNKTSYLVVDYNATNMGQRCYKL